MLARWEKGTDMGPPREAPLYHGRVRERLAMRPSRSRLPREPHRQAREALHELGAQALGAGEIDLVLAIPAQQLFERDPSLGLRGVDAETGVRAVAEREDPRWAARDVE